MPRRSTGATAVALLALSLLLAACGGAAAAPSQAAPPTDAPEATEAADPTPGTLLTACEILTAAEVKDVLDIDADVPPGEHEATPTILSPAHNECRYAVGGVIVSLTPEDGENLYDAARGAYKDAVDITGVGGDGAFFSKKDNRSFVWKGAVTAMLTVFPAEGGWTYDRAEAFAKVILAKL